MIDKRVVLVIAASLFAGAGILARSEGIERETLSGTVVAYDTGLELANGSCRQTIIVRAKRPDKVKENEYIIVQYETSCMKLLPEQILKRGPQRKFSLTRNANCDQVLGELLYMKQLNPTGDVYPHSRLKFVPGGEGEKIPTDEKLPCYVLRSGEFEPTLKERVITGVVVKRDGRQPGKGAYVRLSYTDASPHLVIEADEHGRFAITIFEGVSYSVQAELRLGDRTIYGKPVRIPATGQVTLSLAIKQ